MSMCCLDPTTVLVGGVAVLCVLWWLSTRRPPGLPPGHGPALPLLGHLHLLAKDPRPKFCTWRRQYGDVFSLYMGGRLVVVLASYSAIGEALVTFADVFSDRPHDFFLDKVFKNKGVAGASGSTWKEQRKTSLEILRAMGMGKNVLGDKIQEEITYYIRAIKDHQGVPVDLARMTQMSISNNICSILLGKRYDYTDPEFITIHQCMDEFNIVTATAILNFLLALGYLPGDLFNKHKLLAKVGAIFDFAWKHVVDHRARLEERGEAEDTDFIFSYLRYIHDLQTRGVVDSAVTEEGLQNTVAELFVAGTITTTAALMWALLFLLHHPHVQDRCFREISEVLGPHRPPSISDRPQLTYLEATVQEVLRAGDVAPMAGEHITAQDITFLGYVVPQGTTIIPDTSCVLQDPQIWGDPENFRPERFIGPDGNLTRPVEFIPFGAGNWLCAV